MTREKQFTALLALAVLGCDSASQAPSPTTPSTISEPAPPARISGNVSDRAAKATLEGKTPATESRPSLRTARSGFETRIIRDGESHGPPETPPPGSGLQLIRYPSAVGPLAAYVTTDPGDGQRHPAIIWITGGDCNTIGDVWTPSPRDNDQSARAFREAGIVMMFPSLRGGNDNPDQREGFYGELDDILAAADELAGLPYVDPDHIYLGGHSTGGTMVMLAGAYSDRFRAIFALGPVAGAGQYGGRYVYCDPRDEKEMALRSPILWLHSVKIPMFVFEGAINGNWDACQFMAEENTNPMIQFYRVEGHDHFSLIAPLTELLAQQIVQGRIEISPQALRGLH